MSLIVAIEPDPGQADAVRRAVGELAGVDLILVDSVGTAKTTLKRLPDLILLHSFFSPGDEAVLVAHLHTFSKAVHVQTMTIPLLAAAPGPEQGKRKGWLSGFKRRRPRDEDQGRCDPHVFAAEVGTHLERARQARKAKPANEPAKAIEPRGAKPESSAVPKASPTAAVPEPSPAAAVPDARATAVEEQAIRRDAVGWSGVRDSFGERGMRLGAEGRPVELVRLLPEFTAVAPAISDRIARLMDFDRPAVGCTLPLEHDGQTGALILVSERVPGPRLSELLQRASERSLVPDLPVALFVMRRLLSTAGSLHALTGVTHLGLAPERIVITPRAEVVIIEPGLAGAIEAVSTTSQQPSKDSHFARRDAEARQHSPRVDIAQIARVGIAMMLGRMLDASEEFDARSPMLQEVADVASIRVSEAFSTALRLWFNRALATKARGSFPDFRQAGIALESINSPKDGGCVASRRTLEALLKEPALEGFRSPEAAALEADRIRAVRTRQIARRTAMAAEAVRARELEEAARARELAEAARTSQEVEAARARQEAEATRARQDAEAARARELAEAEARAREAETARAREAEEAARAREAEAARAREAEAARAREVEAARAREAEAARVREAEAARAREVEVARAREAEAAQVREEEERAARARALEEAARARELAEAEAHARAAEATRVREAEAARAREAEAARARGLAEAEARARDAEAVRVREAEAAQVREEEERAARARALEEAARARELAEAARARESAEAEAHARAAEATRVREAEAARAREAEAAWAREVEAARARDVEAARVRDVEAARVREAEAARARELAAAEARAREEDVAAAASAEAPWRPRGVAPLREEADLAADASPVELSLQPLAAGAQTAKRARTKRSVRPGTLTRGSSKAAPIFRWLARGVVAAALVGGLAIAGRNYYIRMTTPGTVLLESKPTGSDVLVDGAAAGRTPLTLTLAPGKHALEMRRKGAIHKFTLNLDPGAQLSQQVDWANIKTTGTLEVTSELSGAIVLVDGKRRGVTPLTLSDVLVGSHEVVLQSKVGMVRRTVEMEEGGLVTVHEPLFSGWVAVFAPFEVQIFEGKRLIGTTTDNPRIMMSPGSHELVLVNTHLGYRATHVLEVNPGETSSFNVKGVEGTVRISAPPGTEVLIDAARVGETPLHDLRVPIGLREMVFRHPQFGEQRMQTTVTVSEPAELTVDFDGRAKD